MFLVVDVFKVRFVSTLISNSQQKKTPNHSRNSGVYFALNVQCKGFLCINTIQALNWHVLNDAHLDIAFI